jgi:hypothetical protein
LAVRHIKLMGPCKTIDSSLYTFQWAHLQYSTTFK